MHTAHTCIRCRAHTPPLPCTHPFAAHTRTHVYMLGAFWCPWVPMFARGLLESAGSHVGGGEAEQDAASLGTKRKRARANTSIDARVNPMGQMQWSHGCWGVTVMLGSVRPRISATPLIHDSAAGTNERSLAVAVSLMSLADWLACCCCREAARVIFAGVPRLDRVGSAASNRDAPHQWLFKVALALRCGASVCV